MHENKIKKFILCLLAGSLNFGCGSSLLYQIYLGSGNATGCDEGAVLSADEREVAFGCVSTVFSSFQFALEAAHACYALLGNTLLQ